MKVRSIKMDDKLWEQIKQFAGMQIPRESAGEFLRTAAEQRMERDNRTQRMLTAGREPA